MFNATWLYVAAIYAVANWLARRVRAGLPWPVAALFYALTLAFFWKPMTGAFTDVATDVLQLLPPWSSLAPPGLNKFTVSNHAQQDVVMQLVPWAHQVREMWKSGAVPLWNELTGPGFPLIANGQGGALSPLRILALPLPLANAMTAEGAFKVLIAATFTWLWCRRRYSAASSTVAALAFAFGPFIIVWLHYAQSTVACWLPAVFLAIDLLREGRTASRFAFAATLGPLVLFSGHPETAAQMLFGAALYVLWIVAVERPPQSARLVVTLLGAGAVAVLLSLPFLVPFFEGMRQSVRYRAVELEPYRDIPFSDFPSLVASIQPRFFGTLPGPTWGPAGAESITAFAGILGLAAWFGVLFHTLQRRRFRTGELFFIALSLLMFLTIANWAPVRNVVQLLIGLAPNARLRLLIAFALITLIAAFLDLVRAGERRALIAGIGGAAVTLAYIFIRSNFPDDAARAGALRAAIPGIVVLALLAATAIIRRNALVAIAAASIVEMWLVTRPYNPIHHIDTLYPRTPLVDAVTRAHDRRAGRVVGLGPVFFPNTNLIFGLEDARMLDAMGPSRYFDLLAASMPTFNPRDYYAKWMDADSPLLDLLNVRWVMAEPDRVNPDSSRFVELYAGPDGKLWENRHALPRFFAARNIVLEFDDARYAERLRTHRDWAHTALLDRLPVRSDQERSDLLSPRSPNAPEASVMIVKSERDDYSMTIDAPRHTLIVSSIGWWKGWRVTADDTPLRPQVVNHAFLGFVVPPGQWSVRVRYVPVSVYVSFAVAAATALVLAGAVLRRRAL